MTTSVGSSILTALGAGSIDTASLVTSLVSATRDPKAQVITNQQSLNTARVSALASAVGSLDTFADALSNVLSGASYAATPLSNNSAIAAVSLLSGGTPTGLPAQLTVKSLASARVLASSSASGATGSSPIGTGTLTITTASGSKPITIDGTNNSYAGLAAAVNAANMGVTATVVTDANGSRLMFKGQPGAASDFSLGVSADDGSSVLGGLGWSGTDSGTIASSSDPKNAKILLDGVEHEYAGNTVDNAIPYLRIDLNQADENSSVTLSMTQPTGTMKDLLKEYVDAYNTLMKGLNAATSLGTDQSNSGVLNGVASVRDMKRQLGQLTSTPLASTGAYKTLADIGIGTNRDGTLTLDSKLLDKAMAADPAGITAMLNPTASTATNPGLSKLMDSVRDNIEKDDGPLKLAQKRYDAVTADLAKQLTDLDDQMASYEDHLKSLYSAMSTRLSALKATQSYLTQQMAVWNNSNNNN